MKLVAPGNAHHVCLICSFDTFCCNCNVERAGNRNIRLDNRASLVFVPRETSDETAEDDLAMAETP